MLLAHPLIKNLDQGGKVVHFKYLIIGGGMTAASAVMGIRNEDSQGTIGMVSTERHAPYDRPPLTKGLWKGKPVDKIYRPLADKGVEVILGRRIDRIDPQTHRAYGDNDEVYSYDKLLLATGGVPSRLPFAPEDILYFRTLNDYEKLRQWTGPGVKFGVIGGGFIGSEIAAALKMNQQDVVMVFPEAGIGARIFPGDLSQFINDYYRKKGVLVLSGKLISGIERQAKQIALHTKDGDSILVDHVIAGIGIKPDTQLAQAAGIQVDDGILVDEQLRTNQPDIFAAGDVARFWNPHLQRPIRVEHEDNANTMGVMAGENMAGKQSSYHHLPFFYSDMFDLGYEAVGDLNSDLDIDSQWIEPYQKGVIYYRQDGNVHGVLLWNVWGKVDQARALIGKTGLLEHID
jgi:3-phenylpropionate/trans-cinnamate dioxygenase ferredoxin reductase component